MDFKHLKELMTMWNILRPGQGENTLPHFITITPFKLRIQLSTRSSKFDKQNRRVKCLFGPLWYDMKFTSNWGCVRNLGDVTLLKLYTFLLNIYILGDKQHVLLDQASSDSTVTKIFPVSMHIFLKYFIFVNIILVNNSVN